MENHFYPNICSSKVLKLLLYSLAKQNTSLISVLRACLKGKSLCAIVYRSHLKCLWGAAQQHVYVRYFNYISQDSLNLRSLFCRERSESRVQPSCQCLRWAFEQLVWNWTKGKMLARAFANVLCNRLSRETTRTVGLGTTGRQDRQASTEVTLCTELGSLKTS